MIELKKQNYMSIRKLFFMVLIPIVLSKRNTKLCKDPFNCQVFSSCDDEQENVGECSNNSVFSEDFQKCVPAVSIEDFQCIILAKFLSDNKNKKKFSSLVHSRKNKTQKSESSEYIIEDTADDGNTYKRMCVVTNWSQFRPGRGRFSFDFIDSTLCNHVIYASVKVAEADYDYDDSEEFEIQAVQHNEMDLYNKLKALKKQNPSLKLVLRVTDENGRIYSKLSKSFDTRLNFCQNLLEYLKDNGFDGAEIEWRWPAGPSGIPADKENLILLLKDLRFKFSSKFIIGIVMSPLTERIQSYNLLEINNLVDYVNVEAFDYYGPWNKKTGLMSPLGKMNEQILLETYLNVEGTIGYLKSLGLSMEKIVLGLAAYSRSFTLQHPMANRINDLTSGNGFSGSFTKTNGMLAYYELCEATKHGKWTEKWHPLAQVPFMYLQNEWISYENKESLAKKVEFVKTNNLAGACVYSIDLDDFRGLFCKQGSYPFLKMSLGLLATLHRKPNNDSKEIDSSKENLDNNDSYNSTESKFKTKISIWNESRSKMLKKMTSSWNSESSEEKTKKLNEARPRISYILITPKAIEKKANTDKRESEKFEKNVQDSTKKNEIIDKKENRPSVKEFSPLIDRSKKGPIISILNTFTTEAIDEKKLQPVALKLLSNENSEENFLSKKIVHDQELGSNIIKINFISKCDGKADGIYREINDCSSFYVCQSESQIKLHEFRCPDGLIFNMRDCTCDWPKIDSPCVIPLVETLCKAIDIKKVQIEDTKLSTQVPTTEKPTTKQITMPASVSHQVTQTFVNNEIFTCSNRQQGTYPDPYDCSKFYYCQPMSNNIKTLTHEFRCPHGLQFNVNICRCDWPLNNNCKIPNHINYPCW